MFSGIVEYQAPLVDLKNLTECNQITLEFDEKRLENLVEGASVAINGVCLTVVKIAGGMVLFEIIKESLNKTNLSDLKIGDLVNIERALKFGDEIGGHLLSGHIIKTAPFLSYGEEKKYHFFKTDAEIYPYLKYKGFIALNGVSLTLNEVSKESFAVSIIPYTLKNTNLSKIQVGERVNVEIENIPV